MSTGSVSVLPTYQAPRQDHRFAHPGSLKRKLSPHLHPVRCCEVSYPSPPMSNPPSPQRVAQEGNPVSSTSEQPQPPTTSATPTSTLMPSVTLATPTLGPPFYQPAAYAPPASIQPAPPPNSSAPTLTPSATAVQHQPGVPIALAHQSSPSSSAARPTSSRGGRKSKAHVASACINCKRAHLSCDVNRPCQRCVASGKQDTCFDVQHKKRGRPRLREEGEFKVEQMLPEPGPSTAMGIGGPDAASRPMMSTRHRRQESFRSLRSQGSDGSGVASSPTYPYPPPPTATQSTFGFQYPHPPSSAPGYEVPTAYLNLDLVIIKANAPWRQIMLGGQDAAGRDLGDIAAPVDGETFQNIRTQLRAERDARDPSYMPPINQPGHDPLQGASEADVERYTQGFNDRTYNWTQTQLGQASQTFPARVRLAKANAYFVAVTLPSFRPVEPAAPQAPPPLFTRMQNPLVPGLQSQTPDSYGSPSRQLTTQSAPPTGWMPFPGASRPLPAPPRSGGHHSSSLSYPPPQLSVPYQQQQQQQQQQQPFPPFQPTASTGTPRLPIAEPPTATTLFTPRTAARELPQPSPAGPQLAPMVGSPAPRPSTAGAGPSEPRRTDITSVRSEDTDDEGTPRKRRRLGLDDVLHRDP